MHALMIIYCDSCGKTFTPGNRKSGVPNGIGFVLEDGRQVNMCADCLMDMDKVTEMCDKLDSDEE